MLLIILACTNHCLEVQGRASIISMPSRFQMFSMDVGDAEVPIILKPCVVKNPVPSLPCSEENRWKAKCQPIEELRTWIGIKASFGHVMPRKKIDPTRVMAEICWTYDQRSKRWGSRIPWLTGFDDFILSVVELTTRNGRKLSHNDLHLQEPIGAIGHKNHL